MNRYFGEAWKFSEVNMSDQDTKRWRAADDEIQDDMVGELMPEWQRYLLYVESAKVRREIALSFEDWKAVERSPQYTPDPAA